MGPAPAFRIHCRSTNREYPQVRRLLGTWLWLVGLSVSSGAQAAVVYSDHFKVLAPRSPTELTDRYDLDVNTDGVSDVRFDYAAFGQVGPSQGVVTGLNGTAVAAPGAPCRGDLDRRGASSQPRCDH